MIELPKQFRPKTSIIYPPFKNGRYMEEYFYDFYISFLNKRGSAKGVIYIPVFWTNIQNHPGFSKTKHVLSQILSEKLLEYDKKYNPIKYFTVVQHDDGILLSLPKQILDKLTIFGACTGDIPLPLIYEDTTNTLEKYRINSINLKKDFLVSFIGSETHSVRKNMMDKLLKNGNNPRIGLQSSKSWTNSVSDSAADKFLEMTIKSEFCLAPRGYGRSSFRFFEAIELGIPPVYIWDDIEWLPYKDIIDYNTFSVSINVNQIDTLTSILESISKETYSNMINKLMDVCKYFTLEFMGKYILYKMSIEMNY